MEILRTYEILIRHDTFDCRNDEFITDTRLEFLQMVFEIWRRRHEYQCVISLNNLIDVTRKEYFIHIEMNAHQISRIMSQATEIVYTIVTTHIPPDMMSVAHQDFGYSSRPTATADNCYFTATKQFLYSL